MLPAVPPLAVKSDVPIPEGSPQPGAPPGDALVKEKRTVKRRRKQRGEAVILLSVSGFKDAQRGECVNVQPEKAEGRYVWRHWVCRSRGTEGNLGAGSYLMGSYGITIKQKFK